MYIFPEEILRAKGFEEENFQALFKQWRRNKFRAGGLVGNRE